MTAPLHPDQRTPLPAAIAAGRVVAILRGLPPDAVRSVTDAVVAGGIRAVEVTLDSPGALKSIAALATRDGVAVGAGTVLSVADAESAVAAGAGYLISPGFDAGVVRWAVAAGVAVLPGAFTPTEVMAAWDAGATAVKLFPAEFGGPAYLKAIRAPLSHIPLVATGGVDATTASAWFAAGATAVAAGGWLVGDRAPAGVTERATALVAACRPTDGAGSDR